MKISQKTIDSKLWKECRSTLGSKDRIHLCAAQSASHLRRDIRGNKWRSRGKEGERRTIRSREKFYSLVIHGCLRITGSLSFTPILLSSAERECTVTRGEKILFIGALSFQVRELFLARTRDLASKHPLSTLSLPFVRCLSVFPISILSLALFSFRSCARQTFVYGSNGRTSPKLTCVRKFDGVYKRCHISISPLSTDKLHLKMRK